MSTKEEIIKDLEKTIDMSKNKFKTCVDHEISPEDFTAYMFGWMQATLEITVNNLKQLD